MGCHEETRPDTKGNDRKAFVFHLDINSVPIGIQVSEPKPSYGLSDAKALIKKNLKQLREAAYYRSQALKLYVVARSKGVCEGCASKAPFYSKRGPYLECHHVHRMADGGPDHPENVTALCPNCHRRAHYAKDAVGFNNKLKQIAVKAEKDAL